MGKNSGLGTRATRAGQLIAGLRKNFPNGAQSLTFGGGSTTVTVDTAVAQLQKLIDNRSATTAARAAARDKVQNEQAQMPALVAFMDADASLDPNELPSVTAPVVAGEADLVLGARKAEPGAWPLTARLANRALCWELRRRGAPRLADMGPMRACRRPDLLELDLLDRRFGWPLEMVLKAVSRGWRVAEVGVAYRRRVGKSKVTGTVKGTMRAVRDMERVLR